jgi:hypothetical protein
VAPTANSPSPAPHTPPAKARAVVRTVPPDKAPATDTPPEAAAPEARAKR